MRRSTPTRSGELRRAIAGSQMAFTLVERAQGLTAVKANTVVALAWRTAHWHGRRRAAELGQHWRHGGRCCYCARERRRRGSGEGTEWRRSGGAGWRPDRVMPVGLAAMATSPAYGRHVANAGWSEAGASSRGRGEGS